MKTRIDIKKLIIVLAAISSLISGSIFMILYARRYAGEKEAPVERSAYNSIVISPENMGSYGELMFAYIGENNFIYNLDDESAPLIRQPASTLLYASDDTVIYTASTELSLSHAGRETVIQELQIGENENTLYTVAAVTVDPCWSSNDEVVYYVKEEALNQLCTFEPLTSTSEVAAVFEENVIGLRISSDGLLVTVESGAELLYVPLSKQLVEAYYNCQGSRIMVCEQYDLILTPEGILYYRWMGSNDAVRIADSVVAAQGFQDNEVLFIQRSQEKLSLNAYFVSEEKTEEYVRLPDRILPQLTVSPDYAFVIDSDGVVYRYNIDTREFGPFTVIPEAVLNPMISVFDYRLMVYDLAREADATFVFAQDAAADVTPEAAEEIAAYSENAALSGNGRYRSGSVMQMASIGSDVYSLQEMLLTLGYLSSAPTGIYDVATTTAVQYLQEDLGLKESGIADGELQHYLSNTSPAEKPAFPMLSVSSKGIRVRELQARLRTLGYIKDPVSGYIDSSTIEGLKRFAEQCGMTYDGGLIRTELQEQLFSETAAPYRGYLTLQEGDCCEEVTSLNGRLKELGYLAGSVNPVYDGKTAEALSLFCGVNDLTDRNGCDEEMQELLFSENALPCPSEMAPADVSDSVSATEGQVISDRQLKILRKWLTKQFAINHTDRQAVKRLQKQLEKLGFLSADGITMIYDQKTMEAVKAFQLANSIEADGIASKGTLTAIFSSSVANTAPD